MYPKQEAARRCKVEFTSRSDDKTPRWIITDGCSEPSLISRLKEEKEKEGEKEKEAEGETEEGREDNSSKGKGETRQQMHVEDSM